MDDNAENLNEENFNFPMADEIDFEEDKQKEDVSLEPNEESDVKYTDNSRQAYWDALKKREVDIEEKIEKLDKKIKNAKLFTKRAEIKKIALNKQLQLVVQERIKYDVTHQNKYRRKLAIRSLDRFHDRQYRKEKDLNNQIRDLQKQKNKLKEAGETRRINNKIYKKQRKLEKLINREIKVTRMQRSMIMGRRALQRRKYMLIKQEAKVDYYQNKEQYMQALRQNINYSNTFTGNIKKGILDKVYNFQENRYRKKKERREAVLKEMQSKKFINVVGANVMVIAKKAIRAIKMDDEKYNENELDNKIKTEELDDMFVNENSGKEQSINHSK